MPILALLSPLNIRLAFIALVVIVGSMLLVHIYNSGKQEATNEAARGTVSAVAERQKTDKAIRALPPSAIDDGLSKYYRD